MPRWNILVLSGPNLSLLGKREPDIYGKTTLKDIEVSLASLAPELDAKVECRQSNHEGVLIDWIHEAMGTQHGLVLNAGALTHTSIALRDAIAGTSLPCVEVHVSNIYARESFRQHSLTAPVCIGALTGFGPASYTLGLRALIDYLSKS